MPPSWAKLHLFADNAEIRKPADRSCPGSKAQVCGETIERRVDLAHYGELCASRGIWCRRPSLYSQRRGTTLVVCPAWYARLRRERRRSPGHLHGAHAG